MASYHHIVRGLGAAGLCLSALAASPEPSAWKTSASVAFKESFDDNIYLQDVGARARQESWISTFIPNVKLAFQPTPAFNATLAYAPEVNLFHSDDDENFTLHRVTLGGGGTSGRTSWRLDNSLQWIAGSDLGPRYPELGGAPAAGGPAVRNRRDAAIETGKLSLTHTIGCWFLRPVVTAYVHDFQTRQKTTLEDPFYQNFVDRNDFNGGVDAGLNVAPGLAAVVGYRYGRQDQAELFGNPLRYDNSYHRVLAGLEGTVNGWLKLNLSLGPEFRTYGDHVAATFQETDRVYLYVDASATLTPTTNDTLTLTAKRFEQPGFTGRSTYDDSTYAILWRRKLSAQWTIGLGGQAYNTEFLLPAVRNDWIYSGNALLACAVTKQFSAELSYGCDFGENAVAGLNAPAREYRRQIVALGLSYTLK